MRYKIKIEVQKKEEVIDDVRDPSTYMPPKPLLLSEVILQTPLTSLCHACHPTAL